MRKNILKQVVERFSLLFEGLSHPKPRRKMRLLAFTFIVCIFSSLVYASVSVHLFSATIGSRGVVKTLGVGVYWMKSALTLSLRLIGASWSLILRRT